MGSSSDTWFDVLDVIRDNFPNGIRDDIIDISRVLRIYSATYPGESVSGDFVLEVIRETGIRDGDRFYFVSSSDANQILDLFSQLFERNSIIYYSVAIQKHPEFFSRLHIFSAGVLKTILNEIDGEHFYFTDFCVVRISTELSHEILTFFLKARKSLSIEDLQARFEYVPPEKIHEALEDRTRYLPTKDHRYFPIANIQFDLDEIEVAKKQISSRIETNGFAESEDYNLESNFALNHEIAEKDLLDLIFEKYLAGDFIKRGKKFLKPGVKIRANDVLKSIREFLATKDEIFLNDLTAVAKSKGIAQHVAINCAFEMMVRVDSNLFVKDSLIEFDVDGIDESLAPFVKDKIIPIRSITSFTGFPIASEYPWNLFLIESFLRKFSRRYIFNSSTPNNSNIGAIYPRSMKFENYINVQAAVILQEKIKIDRNTIGDFLIDRGFRARFIEKTIDQIIDLIQKGNMK